MKSNGFKALLMFLSQLFSAQRAVCLQTFENRHKVMEKMSLYVYKATLLCRLSWFCFRYTKFIVIC